TRVPHLLHRAKQKDRTVITHHDHAWAGVIPQTISRHPTLKPHERNLPFTLLSLAQLLPQCRIPIGGIPRAFTSLQPSAAFPRIDIVAYEPGGVARIHGPWQALGTGADAAIGRNKSDVAVEHRVPEEIDVDLCNIAVVAHPDQESLARPPTTTKFVSSLLIANGAPSLEPRPDPGPRHGCAGA